MSNCVKPVPNSVKQVTKVPLLSLQATSKEGVASGQWVADSNSWPVMYNEMRQARCERISNH